ncbi:Putative disease resistance protein At4g11170 [Linum perenne]
MASSSSSTSPPSRQPYTGKWEHDVFLCFRGDVRDSFVNHLELAMTDKKINYFIDTKLQVTKDINELHRFLERTAISVVVFSEKFADSSWCLDEVHTVVQSMTQFGHRTLPVFFRVDWTTITADYHWYDDWKSSLCSCLFPPNPNTP